MARVVSGFKKQRKSGRSFLTYIALFNRFAKRVLSRTIFTFPSWRGKRQKQSVRPQAYLQRDVSRKRLSNPYTKEPKIKLFVADFFSAQRFRLSFSLLIIATFLWFFLLFLKPTFYLTTVTVKGAQEIDPETIVTMAQEHLSKRHWLLVLKSHRLFLDTDKLATQIHEQYDLEQLEFVPHWPSKSLEIIVKEKPSMLVYAVDNHYYAIDKNGQVIRELGTTLDPKALAVPVIYDYDLTVQPTVSKPVLTSAFIKSINALSAGLTEYPDVHIHSFRIRLSPQREIRIADHVPETAVETPAKKSEATRQLEKAAESIASAKTIDEKVNELKDALKNLEVEKLEEGKLDQLLKEERIYEPNEAFQYQELEVYMQEGWSLKLGHVLFENSQETNELLNIFATLKHQINIEEVREYIDLRFTNRVYYR